jgi:hypothetical protein
MQLRDWLSQNPGPYLVSVVTVPESGDEALTAGYITVMADAVELDGGMIYCRQGDNFPAVLVEGALGEGTVNGPAWVAAYGNLTVPVPGFRPQAVVVFEQVLGGV